jgi:hypothetical protein
MQGAAHLTLPPSRRSFIIGIADHVAHRGRPGRMSRPELRAALAAPAPADGFVSCTPRGRTLTIDAATHNVVTTAGPHVAASVGAFLRSGVDLHRTTPTPGRGVRPVTTTSAGTS